MFLLSLYLMFLLESGRPRSGPGHGRKLVCHMWVFEAGDTLNRIDYKVCKVLLHLDLLFAPLQLFTSNFHLRMNVLSNLVYNIVPFESYISQQEAPASCGYLCQRSYSTIREAKTPYLRAPASTWSCSLKNVRFLPLVSCWQAEGSSFAGWTHVCMRTLRCLILRKCVALARWYPLVLPFCQPFICHTYISAVALLPSWSRCSSIMYNTSSSSSRSSSSSSSNNSSSSNSSSSSSGNLIYLPKLPQLQRGLIPPRNQALSRDNDACNSFLLDPYSFGCGGEWWSDFLELPRSIWFLENYMVFRERWIICSWTFAPWRMQS